MASAQTGKPPVSISLPDLPNVGSSSPTRKHRRAPAPLSDIGRMAAADTGTEEGAADAGEALRARIMAQVEQQQGQAQSKAQAAALAAAEKEAAEAAAKAEKEAKEKAEAARKKAEEEAAKKAEAERLAELAKQYALPTSSYTITSTFGEVAPTGPPATTPASTSPPPPAP